MIKEIQQDKELGASIERYERGATFQHYHLNEGTGLEYSKQGTLQDSEIED